MARTFTSIATVKIRLDWDGYCLCTVLLVYTLMESKIGRFVSVQANGHTYQILKAIKGQN